MNNGLLILPIITAVSIFELTISIIIIFEDFIDLPFPPPDWKKPSRVLPHDLYKRTNMNMIGCVIVSILLFIVLPIVWIYRLLYIIFHLGRN